MDRLDTFVEQHKSAIVLGVIIIALISVVIPLGLTSLPMKERFGQIVIAAIYLIFGFLGVGLVLGFQVWNPFCTPRWLRFFCNLFLIIGAGCFVMGIIAQVSDFAEPQSHMAMGFNSTIGAVVVSYIIRRKYCSDIPELPPIKSPRDAFKRPWFVFGLLMVALIVFFATAADKQKPLVTEFVKQYNSGNPVLDTISGGASGANETEKATAVLRAQFEKRGKIQDYKGVSIISEGIGTGSSLKVVYKIRYQNGGEPDYLELQSVKDEDKTYKLVRFGFFKDMP